jgi:hypothetical protein
MDEKSQENVGVLDYFSGEKAGFGLATFIVRSYINVLEGET